MSFLNLFVMLPPHALSPGCSIVQIFSSTNEEELLRGASLYAIYFVALAVGAGSVQFLGVSPLDPPQSTMTGKELTANLASRISASHFTP